MVAGDLVVVVGPKYSTMFAIRAEPQAPDHLYRLLAIAREGGLTAAIG